MNFYPNYSNLLFAFLVLFLTFVTHAKCDGPYPGLTFDQRYHALISIPSRIEHGVEELNANIALACPAEGDEEENFNSKSLGKNSLFVKEVFNPPVQLKNVHYERCEKAYKMSISRQKSPAEFLFGYEIYVEPRKFPGTTTNNYADFDYVANAFPSRFSSTKIVKPNLELAADRPLKFIWIMMFRVIFDDKKLRPRQVIYTISKSVETGVTCQDYDLGKEIYEIKKIDLKSLYENQRQIYNEAILPNLSFEHKNAACDGDKQCLTKGSLIPPEEFRFRYPEPMNISCSDATTVPIWKSTVQEVLQTVDRFLYAMSKTIHDDLEITAGAHGQLKLPKDPLRTKTKSIKLGNKNSEIIVPNVIYKIVKVEVLIRDMDCEQNCSKLATKAIIIVISNDPYFEPKDAFCDMQNCANWGWKSILSEQDPSTGSPPKYVFCCQRNEETLKNLGLKLEGDKTRLLDLTHFPIHDAKSGNIEYGNIEQDVIKKMKKLFEDENDSNDDNVDEDRFYSFKIEDDKHETKLESGEILSQSTNSGGSDDEKDEVNNEKDEVNNEKV